MLPSSPRPCRNCGQVPLPGAPYCTYCGTPQFASAPSSSPSCLFAVLGVLGAAALFAVVFFGLVSSNAGSWQTPLLLALLVCGLVGGVSLLPHFPGMVRGLGLGLIVGAIVSAVLLGGLMSCLEGLKNI